MILFDNALTSIRTFFPEFYFLVNKNETRENEREIQLLYIFLNLCAPIALDVANKNVFGSGLI